MPRGGALLIALFALAIGVLAYVLGVGSWLGQRAEASVLDASDFTYDPPAPLSLVTVPAVAIALLLIALLAWRYHGLARAVSLLVGSAAAVIASRLLKLELLERPDLFELDVENTFPSGHMTVFTVLAGALIWAVPAGSRGIAALAGAALMGTAAWQLLEYGWHRPSDLLGALALGVLAFALAAVLQLPRRSRGLRRPARGAAALNRVLSALLVFTGGLLVIGGLIMIALASWRSSDALLLVAGEVALVGASLIAAHLLMRLAR